MPTVSEGIWTNKLLIFFLLRTPKQNNEKIVYPSIKWIYVIKIIIINRILTVTFDVFYRNPFETTEGFIEKYNQAQGCKEQEQYDNLAKQFLVDARY